MLSVEALDVCWKEGWVLRKHRERDGKGKTCREQGNQSSLGKRRRISRDEEMDGNGSVRMQKGRKQLMRHEKPAKI